MVSKTFKAENFYISAGVSESESAFIRVVSTTTGGEEGPLVFHISGSTLELSKEEHLSLSEEQLQVIRLATESFNTHKIGEFPLALPTTFIFGFLHAFGIEANINIGSESFFTVEQVQEFDSAYVANITAVSEGLDSLDEEDFAKAEALIKQVDDNKGSLLLSDYINNTKPVNVPSGGYVYTFGVTDTESTFIRITTVPAIPVEAPVLVFEVCSNHLHVDLQTTFSEFVGSTELEKVDYTKVPFPKRVVDTLLQLIGQFRNKVIAEEASGSSIPMLVPIEAIIAILHGLEIEVDSVIPRDLVGVINSELHKNIDTINAVEEKHNSNPVDLQDKL